MVLGVQVLKHFRVQCFAKKCFYSILSRKSSHNCMLPAFSIKFFGIVENDFVKYFQELTDWANDVLKQKKLPLITDLRKSVGDGYTLPTILEIVSKYNLNRNSTLS